jgi:hypothetical protein
LTHNLAFLLKYFKYCRPVRQYYIDRILWKNKGKKGEIQKTEYRIQNTGHRIQELAGICLEIPLPFLKVMVRCNTPYLLKELPALLLLESLQLIMASREAYHTIGAPGWQRRCRNSKSNVGCPWRVNGKTTFH